MGGGALAVERAGWGTAYRLVVWMVASVEGTRCARPRRGWAPHLEGSVCVEGLPRLLRHDGTMGALEGCRRHVRRLGGC